MPCPPSNTCAHETSLHLASNGYPELNAGKGADQRIVNGMLRCKCGAVLRAKELRAWAANKGKKAQEIKNNGIYVVYQQRNKDGQGHVYSVINGDVCGNEVADGWDGWDREEYYKLN